MSEAELGEQPIAIPTAHQGPGETTSEGERGKQNKADKRLVCFLFTEKN